MKKIHSFAIHALATSAITLGAGSVLAQPTDAPSGDREQTITSRDQDARISMPEQEQGTQSKSTPAPTATQNDPNKQHFGQSETTTAAERNRSQTATERRTTPDASQAAADRGNARSESRMQNRGYMGSAPTNGVRASNLIGTEVKTTDGENVGPVSDLIIDANGQIVAIVVGVGGFLGMGEKDVAIGWDDVTRSRASDKHELRVNATREALRSAPKFEKQD